MRVVDLLNQVCRTRCSHDHHWCWKLCLVGWNLNKVGRQGRVASRLDTWALRSYASFCLSPSPVLIFLSVYSSLLWMSLENSVHRFIFASPGGLYNPLFRRLNPVEDLKVYHTDRQWAVFQEAAWSRLQNVRVRINMGGGDLALYDARSVTELCIVGKDVGEAMRRACVAKVRQVWVNMCCSVLSDFACVVR